MKRVFFIPIALCASALSAQPGLTLSENADGYNVSVAIDEYTIEKLYINEPLRNGETVADSFAQVKLTGWPELGNPGEPSRFGTSLDLATETEGAEVSYTINQIDTVKLSTKLFPIQYYLRGSGDEKRSVFAFDKNAYDQWRWQSPATEGETFQFRKQNAVTISISPVQYDFSRNELYIIRSMDVSVKCEKPVMLRSGGSESYDALMREKFFNVQNGTRAIPSETSRQKKKYLVIASASYLNNPDLKRLTDYRAKEFNVEIVEASKVGTTKDNFRDFIRGKMPDFALLVGNLTTFPTHTFTFNFSPPVQVRSLSYYAGSKTTGEPTPDIAMGIMVTNNATDIKNMVDKTIATEANTASMPNKYVGVGGNTSPMGPLAANHCDKVVEEMWTRFFQPKGYQYTSSYSTSSGATTIVSAVNSGARFVNYNGHGSKDGWQYGWSNRNLASLTNTKFFPAVLSCACLTGTFDYASGTSMAQSYIGNAKGPSAFIGSYESSSMGQHQLNYGVYEAIMEKNITRYGLAFVYGANGKKIPKSTSAYPPATTYTQLMQWQYHYYGDPALETVKALVSVDAAKPVASMEGIKISGNSIILSLGTQAIGSKAEIGLYNLQGKMVRKLYSGAVTSKELSIDPLANGGISMGCYIVQAKMGNNTHSARLIINH